MKLKVPLAALLCLLLISCGKQAADKPVVAADTSQPEETAVPSAADLDPLENKGIGPIKSVELGDISEPLVKQGEEVFKAKCTACHKMEKRYIGPALVGITERRTPEWIMNMILNPDEMVMKDPHARQLLMEYAAPMANQSLTEPEARQLLEYFRANKEPTTSEKES